MPLFHAGPQPIPSSTINSFSEPKKVISSGVVSAPPGLPPFRKQLLPQMRRNRNHSRLRRHQRQSLNRV
jgi:hypothetical protein